MSSGNYVWSQLSSDWRALRGQILLVWLESLTRVWCKEVSSRPYDLKFLIRVLLFASASETS